MIGAADIEAKNAQFREHLAFGRGNIGKRHNGSPTSQTSLVASVVFGWDDRHGSAERRDGESLAAFGGAAGARTGEVSGMNRRKQGFGMKSSVDEILLGRDIDASGNDPHADFMNQFFDHAGIQTSTLATKRDCFIERRQPGLRGFMDKRGPGGQCTVDEIIHGVDMDGSGGEDPHMQFMNQFGDRAGQRAGAKERLLKPAISLRSTVDTVMLGHDIDGSGDAMIDEMLEVMHQGAAGMRASEGRDRAKRRPLHVASVMNTVVHNQALTKQPAQEFFNGFADHAGTRTYHTKPVRSKSSPYLGAASPSVCSARGPREGRQEDFSKHMPMSARADFTPGHMGRTFKPEDLQAFSESPQAQTLTRSATSIVPQRVNPFGQGRRPSTCSSVSSLPSNAGGARRKGNNSFNDATSSQGSTRPKWQR